MKILIVDDEENILRMLKKALNKAIFSIMVAKTIEEAEYAISNSFFDLVISDIKLTGILGREGLELLSYIKEKSPNSKVIIMTGYGSPQIQEEAYEKGAFYYFEKPIDLRILLKKVEDLEREKTKNGI